MILRRGIFVFILGIFFFQMVLVQESFAAKNKNKSKRSGGSRKERPILPLETEIKICKSEAEKRLSELELRGNLRFSKVNVKENPRKTEDAEFPTFSKRRQTQPVKGRMISFDAEAQEEKLLRTLSTRCGISRGKVATFTYEFTDVLNKKEEVKANSSLVSGESQLNKATNNPPNKPNTVLVPPSVSPSSSPVPSLSTSPSPSGSGSGSPTPSSNLSPNSSSSSSSSPSPSPSLNPNPSPSLVPSPSPSI